MKKLIYIFLTAGLLFALTSCDVDKPSGDSIFIDDDESLVTEFDTWLEYNYRIPYNIRFVYRMLDNESDQNYYVVPADINQSFKLAKTLKHAVLETYDDVVGPLFLMQYFPKMLHIIGSGQYNNVGTVVGGVAEGGMKITLTDINGLDFSKPSSLMSQFQTVHHEFAHILHQTKEFTEEYRQISGTDYQADSWQYFGFYDALNAGFISQYASNTYHEDFVELYAHFVTMSSEEFNSLISMANEEGQRRFAQKLAILEDYFEDTWGYNINEIRDVSLQKLSELGQLDLD